jgi:hypothetical protein
MAASRAADAELLLPESAGYLELDDPLRKTKDVTQFELKKHVDVRTAQNSFSLTLDHFGPYNCSYTRNGKFLLLSGEKGHVALMDWKKKKLVTETHVKVGSVLLFACLVFCSKTKKRRMLSMMHAFCTMRLGLLWLKASAFTFMTRMLLNCTFWVDIGSLLCLIICRITGCSCPRVLLDKFIITMFRRESRLLLWMRIRGLQEL